MLILYGFVAVWALVGLSLSVAPFRSFDNSTGASLLALAYVGVSALATLVLNLRRQRARAIAPQWRVERTVWILLLVAAVGVAFHIYAKVVLLGIDYSKGIAVARETWLASGDGGAGASSLASMLGYLLSSFHFAAWFLTLRYWESFPRPRACLLLVTTLLLNMLFFGALGSRSGVIALVALGLTVLCLRQHKQLGTLPPLGGRLRVLFWPCVALVPLAYAMLLFSERVGGYDNYAPPQEVSPVQSADALIQSADQVISSDYYLMKLALRIHGVPSDSFSAYMEIPPALRRITNYLFLCGIYVSHTQWTWAYVMTLPQRPGLATPGHLTAGLIALGLLDASSQNKPDLGYSNLSLPGALWYDGGTAVLLMAALVQGLLMGWLIRCCRRDVPLFLELAYCAVGVALLLSPMASMGAILPGPFILFALGILALPSIVQSLARNAKRAATKRVRARQ